MSFLAGCIALTLQAQQRTMLPSTGLEPATCVIKGNHSNAQPFEKSINIKAWIENSREKGGALKFEAGATISKVIIYY